MHSHSHGFIASHIAVDQGNMRLSAFDLAQAFAPLAERKFWTASLPSVIA